MWKTSGAAASLWNLPSVTVATILAFSVVWALGVLTVDELRFVILSPVARAGVEIALALGSLFVATILLFFPEQDTQGRVLWIAGGFLALGIGGLFFGYALPLIQGPLDLNTSMYAALAVRSAATMLFVLGLVPSVPPPVSARITIPAALVLLNGAALIVLVSDRLPRLVANIDLEQAAQREDGALRGMSHLHYALWTIPIVLSFAATLGALHHYPGSRPRGWLAAAMAIGTGALVHAMLWPSAFSPILTTASLLRVMFLIVVVVGGIFELRQVSRERSAVLEAERESAARTAELVAVKSDVTRLIAHELASPLSAVRRFTEILELDAPESIRNQAILGIKSQLGALEALVDDVRAIATIEREDFSVRPVAVPCQTILDRSVSLAQSLSGSHDVRVRSNVSMTTLLRADPERIGQVLQNLLVNAVKYSPAGTPVELAVSRRGESVRFAVVDCGIGIDQRDLFRIFEKFERGKHLRPNGASGIGAGLYISRRILEAHGSRLDVETTPGQGSTFSFALEVVNDTSAAGR